MKKLALSVILGASLMITPSAFALKAMSDSNMKSATGQAGVTIAIDDVTLYQSIGTTVYRDTDGLGGANSDPDTAHQDAAGIYISGADTLTTIRAILDGTNRGGFLQNGYADMMNGTGAYKGTRQVFDTNGTTVLKDFGALAPSALTIDVARAASIMTKGKKFNVDEAYGISEGDTVTSTSLYDAVAHKAYLLGLETGDLLNADGTPMFADEDAFKATAGVGDEAAMTLLLTKNTNGSVTSFTDLADLYNDFAVSGVVIGLPTIEIVKNGSVKDIGLTTEGLSFNNNKKFITIKKSNSTLAILGGTLEIVAH